MILVLRYLFNDYFLSSNFVYFVNSIPLFLSLSCVFYLDTTRWTKISRFIWLAVGKTNFSLTFNLLTVMHWLWPRCEPRSWLIIAKYHKSLPVWHLRSPRVHDLLRSSTYICMLYWSGVNGKPLASEDAGFAASRYELLDFF